MSKKQQEAAVVLSIALIGGAVAGKVASKQAAVLGIPAVVVAVLGWLVAQAIA